MVREMMRTSGWGSGALLVAIVVANLLVARFGPWALPITAFFLVSIDLIARDILHETWLADRLWLRMTALIATGSLLSAAINLDAWRIALASFCAFGVAGLGNTVAFHALYTKGSGRMARMNVSNFFAAVLDSSTFPLVAFGKIPVSLLAHSDSTSMRRGPVFFFRRLMSRKPSSRCAET